MSRLLAILCACVTFVGSARVPEFRQAISVWPAGLRDEMNSRLVFEASFDADVGDVPTLLLCAWYSYRVRLNGEFVAFGPARGPKGYFKADELPLKVRAGRNRVTVEVACYNVPNFYLMEQPPFIKAEVVLGDRILAATTADFRAQGAFVARRDLSHVMKVPRYSFQRTFAEAFRLPAPVGETLVLAVASEPCLIERRAPYPDYEFEPELRMVSHAAVRFDPSAATRSSSFLTLPSMPGSRFKGFREEDLEINSYRYSQHLVYSGRHPAAESEKANGILLNCGESALFDRGFADTGFPVLQVCVTEPGRLVMEFDETTLADGSARGIKRVGNYCNVIVWDVSAPGDYELTSFEPYVMRYLSLAALEGAELRVLSAAFRSYKNATAKRASFRSSDPSLERIFNAANETFRQNAVDVFTDCPSRERAGWNCDAFFTGPVATLLTGSGDLERVFEECLALPKMFDDIPEGMLPMCYPADHVDGNFIPNWALWFVLETEEYLTRTGDRVTVDLLRTRLEKLIDYLHRFRNSDGLLEKLPGWVFVEWSRCNDLVQDVNYPSNMTWADALDAMDRLYGRPDLANEAQKVRATILKQSWTGKWFCDNALRQSDGRLRLSGECTETCQYYAFFHKVATPKSHPELWQTLLKDFGPMRYDPADRKKLLKHPDVWPSNAFIGNYLRLKLLERAELGNQILMETKGYFDYMAQRTGTLWENDTTSASCDHGFASYAAFLLVRSVLGADIDLVHRTVTIRETDANLEFCEATLPVGSEQVTVTRRRGLDGLMSTDAKVPTGWKIVRK